MNGRSRATVGYDMRSLPISVRGCACRLTAGLSRRAVLERFGMGLGGIALADLVNPAPCSVAGSPATDRPAGSRRARRTAARPCAGQARHLSLHGRRAVADGDVRLQAGAQPAERRGAAGFRAAGAAAHRHVGQPVVAPARRVAVRVPPARPQRHVGQRSAAAHRRASSTSSASSDRCITEAINHDPAITFFQSGSQIAGRPSMGAWVHYGLGSDNEDLPAFVVLITPGKVDQPLYSRLWGNGFLPRSIRACSSAAARTPCSISRTPTAYRRASRRTLLDRLQGAAGARGRTAGRRGRRRAASRSTKWRSACRRACPA